MYAVSEQVRCLDVKSHDGVCKICCSHSDVTYDSSCQGCDAWLSDK